MIELESLDTLRNRRMNIQLFWLELLSFINIILIYFWHFPLRQSIKSTNMPTVRIFWQTLWCLMSLVWYYYSLFIDYFLIVNKSQKKEPQIIFTTCGADELSFEEQKFARSFFQSVLGRHWCWKLFLPSFFAVYILLSLIF